MRSPMSRSGNHESTMTASGEAVSASAHALAPPSASRTCQRSPVRISLSLCRKLQSALAMSAVRGRTHTFMGKAGVVQVCISKLLLSVPLKNSGFHCACANRTRGDAELNAEFVAAETVSAISLSIGIM